MGIADGLISRQESQKGKSHYMKEGKTKSLKEKRLKQALERT